MSHQEAIDLSVVLQEVLGVPSIWKVIREGGHEDLILQAAGRLKSSLAAHWEENGCSFDQGRDGMIFPETCDAAR